MVKKLDNKTARRLFLYKHGLCANPGARCGKDDLLATIEKIGFVQLDSIRTVERAHDLILFSRHQTYKHHMLREMLEEDRCLFENWTHDASIIPSMFYPYWKHRFVREKAEIIQRWEKWGRKGFRQLIDDVTRHIAKNGPTLSRELKPPEKKGRAEPGWWDWHPAKSTLEYLWRTGETAICHRQGFQKAYDLAGNVILPRDLSKQVSVSEFRDWACRSALERLGFATHGEIAAFWALVKPDVVRNWIEQNKSDLMQIEVESFDKKSSKSMWCDKNLPEQLEVLPSAPSRIRILSPFDPLLRDRKRAAFLFGFDYRIEIFVPEARRKYGYYVFPVLQGDQIIGRVDMKAERKSDVLAVRRVWLEKQIKWTKSRICAFESELSRLAKFSGLADVHIAVDALANGHE